MIVIALVLALLVLALIFVIIIYVMECMTMYVTYGTTESGDDLQVIVWDCCPTDSEVNEAYSAIYPEEYSEVGFVNWSVQKAVRYDTIDS